MIDRLSFPKVFERGTKDLTLSDLKGVTVVGETVGIGGPGWLW